MTFNPIVSAQEPQGRVLISIDLPKPISTNRLFKNKAKGRACTEAYNTWKLHAKAAIQSQKPFTKPSGPVRLLFAVGEVGLRKDMDGDNCLKCLIDALVDAQIIPDDKREHVRGVGMEWVPGKAGATAYIAPAEALPPFVADVPIVGSIS